MNFAQLVTAVYTETNRPDLVAETSQAILEVTQSLHLSDLYYKDILEATIVFDQSTWYLQALDLTSLPRFRQMGYVRKTDPSLTQAEQTNTLPPVINDVLYPNSYYNLRFNFLKRVDIGDVLDRYGYEKLDIWYQAGTQINIKSSTPLQYVVVGWYAYPDIGVVNGSPNFNSWIAVEYPYAIIYGAAGTIFKKIGEDKSAAAYLDMPKPNQGEESGGSFYQQRALLRRNNIRAAEE